MLWVHHRPCSTCAGQRAAVFAGEAGIKAEMMRRSKRAVVVAALP
jgi:hypothetical protein